jgi:hypothetical protein
MTRIFSALATGALLSGLMFAQDTAKDDMKKAGSDVKQAGKSSTKAAKSAGKGVAKGTKKGVNKAAGATENGAAKVKDKTKTTQP